MEVVISYGGGDLKILFIITMFSLIRKFTVYFLTNFEPPLELDFEFEGHTV